MDYAHVNWHERARTLTPEGRAFIDGRCVAWYAEAVDKYTELKTTWIDLA